MSENKKICTKCGEAKARSEFHKLNRSKDGLQYRCIVCHNKDNKVYRESNRDRESSRVRAYYAANRDAQRRVQKAYADSHKEEAALRQKAWIEVNREHHIAYHKAYNSGKSPRRNNYLKRKYGITQEDYDLMLENQSHGCNICGAPRGRSRLSVDHCHTTGKVRGLLCNNCNSGLGWFKDAAAVLASAIKYLNESSETTNESL